MARIAHGAVLLALFALPKAVAQFPQAKSQQPPSSGSSTLPALPNPIMQPSDAQAKIRVNSDLVVLSVTVKDRNGNLVSDLRQQDFRIFDDDVEQVIDVFAAEGLPLSLVILVDDDLKSEDAERMAPTLRAIVGGISSSDEVAAARFDVLFYAGDGFTSDQDKLLAELKDVQDHSGPSTTGPVPFVTPPSTHSLGVGEPVTPSLNLGSRPTKALDDAVYGAAGLLHDRDISRRKVILLISDGINGPQLNHHSYASVVELLLRDNISVFSIAIGSSSARRKFSRLADYANDSGGELFYAAKSRAMEQLYSRITEQARHEYTLAYVPRGNKRSSNYHKLQVRTTRDVLFPRTREGYYANLSSETSKK